MIAGAPAGHLAGDPVDTGSLARVLNNNLGTETLTFSTITPAYFSTFNSVIKDNTQPFIDPVSPLNVGNTALNPEARYIYDGGIYISLDPLLKDPSAGLLLNRVTSETVIGLPSFSSMALPPFLRNGGFEPHMINKKERFDVGRCPNGN